MANKCGCPVCQGRRRWFKPVVGLGAGNTGTFPPDPYRVAVIVSGSPDASGAFLVYPIFRFMPDGTASTNATIETGVFGPVVMGIETYGQLIIAGFTIINDSATAAIRVSQLIMEDHDVSEVVRSYQLDG